MRDAIQKMSQKNIPIRILAVGLLLFFLFFGMEMKDGYCFGAEVFRSLGLRVWSNIDQGWFYPGVLGIVGALASMALFSFATKNRLKTFGYLMEGTLVVVIVCYLLGLSGIL